MKTFRKLALALMVTYGFAGFSGFAASRDTLRIATYNLLNFPGSDPASRIPYFRTVVQTMKPDILVVQEMLSQSGVTSFLNEVMNQFQPGAYDAVTFHDGPDTDNSMFFRTDKVTSVDANYLPTSPRHIAEYIVNPAGTSEQLRIYSIHFKAGQTDTLARLTEATYLRNYLNNLPTGSQFIILGDYNIYRSDEPAFQKFLADEGNNNGRVRDPLNAVGVWNNYTFRFIHTQSTRVRSFGGGATGGLDDRFDMILPSYSLDDNMILSSYTAYGNDGNHYNDSINRLPNAAVPDSVANALHYAADHIPVFADFYFGGITDVSATEFGPATYILEQNFPNPFNPSTVISYTIPTGQLVSLKIYDVLGREVATLVQGEQRAGTHAVVWDAAQYSSGTYFYRLQSGAFVGAKRLVLIK